MKEEKIGFSQELKENNYKLFLFPKEIKELINEGKELKFKSTKEGNIICCTEDSTYKITKVETTNSLLLKNESKIEKVLYEHYELSKIEPENLKEILNILPYCRSEKEEKQLNLYSNDETSM
jgi:hypothetical protein